MTGRILLLCIAALVRLCAQPYPVCPGSPAAPEMTAGETSLNDARLAEAAEHFQAATQLDASCVNAWLYLGKAYVGQYVPGRDSPENLDLAAKAREAFENAVAQQPQNEEAIASIALLYFNQKKLEDAQDWYDRLAIANPENKEAFYTLGLIAWTRCDPPRRALRAKLGLKPDDPGPLPDSDPVRAFRGACASVAREGIENLERALQLDGEYEDAMNYLNLLYRIKADSENSLEESRDDIARADEWLRKSVETKKAKSERGQ